MITMALEFSSPVRSVAVLARESQTNSAAVLGAASDEGARTLKPLNLVERALGNASVGLESIERLVVGLGPGSYTGIRSSIALAQGWQLARPIRLTGMSTVVCLAAQAHAKGWFGNVNVVIDAQRGEVYVARFEINPSGWRETEPLRLATIEEARGIATTPSSAHPATIGLADSGGAAVAPTLIVGPEVARWFPEGRTLVPDAAVLGGLSRGRTDSSSGEELEPIYLRQTCFVKAPLPRVLPLL